jgi:hypothetical protein
MNRTIGLARLAPAALGAGRRTWRAYLNTSGAQAVNARDRIGRGPWRNAKREVSAGSLAELHGNNALNQQTALTERGRADQRPPPDAKQP